MSQEMALMLNLPPEMTVDILSRLPVRTVRSCKCVCKKWLELISTSEFLKNHFHNLFRLTPGFIFSVREFYKETTCRIFDVEDEVGLVHHDLRYKPVMKFNPNTLNSSQGTNLLPICSVDGLLCLHDCYFNCNLDAIYVCNPTTHEYISLPVLRRPKNYRPYYQPVKYGIGVSLLRCQYKVVRIIWEGEPGEGSDSSRLDDVKVECMVYTLGTGSWRSIQPHETYEYDLHSPDGQFLKGNLHWLVKDVSGSRHISCFDLETELFKLMPTPFPKDFPLNATLGILGNCLSFCFYFIKEQHIEIWIMQEYGVQESWAKKFVVNFYPHLHRYDLASLEDEQRGSFLEGFNEPTFYALEVFKDGDILMLEIESFLFYRCKKTGGTSEIGLFERASDCCIYAVRHTPSFLSLTTFELENVSSFQNDG